MCRVTREFRRQWSYWPPPGPQGPWTRLSVRRKNLKVIWRVTGVSSSRQSTANELVFTKISASDR